MEANLIKVEGGLDDLLHPKKTVKKKYRDSLLNVNSKNFKTRQKSLNKLTTKTPLQPEEEEDLDTESSDDHNELGYYGDDEERLPESETVLNVTSNNFQTEEEDGNNGTTTTMCQKTLYNLTNKTPLVEPEQDLDTKSSDDGYNLTNKTPLVEPEQDLDTKSSDYVYSSESYEVPYELPYLSEESEWEYFISDDESKPK